MHNNGAVICARYAYAPNYYHYCGPDTKGELGHYIQETLEDARLVEYLAAFEVMYPYLEVIAEANGIVDPLDTRVVEAYWVGNALLERVSERQLYKALVERQRLPRRISKTSLRWLLPKIDAGARLHHSFHVFNVFTRTGHHTVEHTVETMDQCRISWGVVRSYVAGSKELWIDTQRLVYTEGELDFTPTTRLVYLPLDEWKTDIEKGAWVSVHWGFVCDVLTLAQVRMLERYTQHHLALANSTL